MAVFLRPRIFVSAYRIQVVELSIILSSHPIFGVNYLKFFNWCGNMPQLFNFYRFLLPGCFIKKFYRTLQSLNKKIPCLSTEFIL